MNLEELFLVAAIQPGDDFLAVGMFDFNVAEDVSATRGILKGLKRERPWRGVTV
jgi:hypothetical protein